MFLASLLSPASWDRHFCKFLSARFVRRLIPRDCCFRGDFWKDFQLLFKNLLKKLAFDLFLYSNKGVDLVEAEGIANFSSRSPLLSGDRDRIVSEGGIIISSLVLVLR